MKLSQVDFVNSVEGPGLHADNGTRFTVEGRVGKSGYDLRFENGFIRIASLKDSEADVVLVPVHNVRRMIPVRQPEGEAIGKRDAKPANVAKKTAEPTS